MTKEKLQSLQKYSDDIRAKLKSAVPSKHVNRQEEYKAFLTRELRLVEAKIHEEKQAVK